MNIEIEWKDDCQGKKDYDADLVMLSSRYYPRGGGFWIVSGGQIQDNNHRPEIKPSAVSSILFGDEVLVRKEFEGETEAKVKAQVEEWAFEQICRIREAVKAAFHEATNPGL